MPLVLFLLGCALTLGLTVERVGVGVYASLFVLAFCAAVVYLALY